LRAYLVYDIDKVLGIVSREVLDHLNLVAVREDTRDKGNSFVRGEGMADQPFPGWTPAARKKTVKSMNG